VALFRASANWPVAAQSRRRSQAPVLALVIGGRVALATFRPRRKAASLSIRQQARCPTHRSFPARKVSKPPSPRARPRPRRTDADWVSNTVL